MRVGEDARCDMIDVPSFKIYRFFPHSFAIVLVFACNTVHRSISCRIPTRARDVAIEKVRLVLVDPDG